MAGVQTIQGINWKNYTGNPAEAVAPLLLDFTTFDSYVVTPVGTIQTLGAIPADGVVIDNLLNSGSITVEIGPLVETIPPYTKQSLKLYKSYPSLKITGAGTRTLVTFYVGAYPGTANNTNFYQAQLDALLAVETGQISIWPGSLSNMPQGYLACDGSAISRTTFAGLFAKIGTLYGAGDGSTTFNLPNCTGVMIVGAGARAGFTSRTVGTGGGAETVQLGLTEIPSHTHAVNDPAHTHGVYDSGHQHRAAGAGGYAVGGGATGSPFWGGSGGFYTDLFNVYGDVVTTGIRLAASYTGISNAFNGGSGAHQNMPPFLAMNFIIKT